MYILKIIFVAIVIIFSLAIVHSITSSDMKCDLTVVSIQEAIGNRKVLLLSNGQTIETHRYRVKPGDKFCY